MIQKQLRAPVFTGVATALVTPFREGAVDDTTFEALIERQIAGGVSALVVAGTTGEAAMLHEEERTHLLRRAAACIRGRIPWIAGTGTNSTDGAIRYSRAAEEAGADALLVVTPYYCKGTAEGLVRHYYAIADAVSLPVIVYNVPSRTGVNLPVALLERLAEHPRIVGLKEAGDSTDRLADIRCNLGDRMALYAGNDSQIVPVLALGGCGVVSVLSNLLPRETADICRLWQEGKVEESAALQLRLLPLIRLLFAETNPAPLKCAMELCGLCRNELRLPMAPVGETLRQAIAQELGRFDL